MIKVKWREGQVMGEKRIPSSADVKVAEGMVVFMDEEHDSFFVAIPLDRLISAVEEADLDA